MEALQANRGYGGFGGAHHEMSRWRRITTFVLEWLAHTWVGRYFGLRCQAAPSMVERRVETVRIDEDEIKARLTAADSCYASVTQHMHRWRAIPFPMEHGEVQMLEDAILTITTHRSKIDETPADTKGRSAQLERLSTQKREVEAEHRRLTSREAQERMAKYQELLTGPEVADWEGKLSSLREPLGDERFLAFAERVIERYEPGIIESKREALMRDLDAEVAPDGFQVIAGEAARFTNNPDAQQREADGLLALNADNVRLGEEARRLQLEGISLGTQLRVLGERKDHLLSVIAQLNQECRDLMSVFDGSQTESRDHEFLRSWRQLKEASKCDKEAAQKIDEFDSALIQLQVNRLQSMDQRKVHWEKLFSGSVSEPVVQYMRLSHGEKLDAHYDDRWVQEDQKLLKPVVDEYRQKEDEAIRFVMSLPKSLSERSRPRREGLKKTLTENRTKWEQAQEQAEATLSDKLLAMIPLRTELSAIEQQIVEIERQDHARNAAWWAAMERSTAWGREISGRTERMEAIQRLPGVVAAKQQEFRELEALYEGSLWTRQGLPVPEGRRSGGRERYLSEMATRTGLSRTAIPVIL